MGRHRAPTIPEAEQNNPVRRADWRWQWAQRIVAQNISESRWQRDAWLAVAVHLVRREQGLCGRARGRSAWDVADAQAARELAFGASESGLHARLRLLAGQSANAIATEMQRSADVVHAFAALFFEVRDRLAARDWIYRVCQEVHDLDTAAGRAQAAACQLVYAAGPSIIPAVRSVVASVPLLAQAADLSTEQGKLAEWVRLSLVLLGERDEVPATGSWRALHASGLTDCVRPNTTVCMRGVVPALERDVGRPQASQLLEVCRLAEDVSELSYGTAAGQTRAA